MICLSPKELFSCSKLKGNVFKKLLTKLALEKYTKGAFVWDQSRIRIIGIMQVSVCLGAILILEYVDSRSRIAGIYSGIHSYSGIFPNERALR